MPVDDSWIASRVAGAREAHQSITDAAVLRMTVLLKGDLTERQLSGADLVTVAKELLSDMEEPEVPKDTAVED